MDGHIKFRKDLQVYRYEDIGTKQSVVLKDFVSGKYYYLSVYEYRLLQALDGTASIETAVDRLALAGHHYPEPDVRAILSKAAQLGLILGTKFGTAESQNQQKQAVEKARKNNRFSSVYFMFIPLVNPDRFLDRTLWLAKLAGSPVNLALLAMALPGALYLLIRGSDRLLSEYLFFFTWTNLLILWATLAITKLIHEFSHAYVAKHYGLHVPQMGVAFLIFFPCLFCNTTDAWQLADRKQRMAISAAGVMAEAAMAIIATYVWYFTKPGLVNSLAFYMMAVSFVSTVLFNGNPLMRFDGYFVIMDYLRLPNLYTRSSAHLRYLIMNRVLGIPGVTTTATTPREWLIFSVYGVAAFVWRIVLYTGICMTVYHKFDKLVGVLLGCFALILFVIRPVCKGLLALHARRREIRPRLAGTLALGCVVVVLGAVALVPVAGNSSFPCYLTSAKVQKIAVPLQTAVAEVFVRQGSAVAAGTQLLLLDPAQLLVTLRQKEIKREVLLQEARLLLLDDSDKAKAAPKDIEVMKLDDEIVKIKRELSIAESGIRAPFDGVVTTLDFRLQPGFQPGDGAVVGEIESTSDCLVTALIPEQDLPKVRMGGVVTVWLDVAEGLVFKSSVVDVKPYSERELKNLPFSSRLGGELATEARSEEHADIPLEAHYACSVAVPSTAKVPLGTTGRMFVGSPPRSLWARFLDSASKTFNRESLL